MTQEDHGRIAAAQAHFAQRTKGLDPRTLEMILRGMAGRAIGFNSGEIDPVEHALASHSLEMLELRNKAERIKGEHEQFERSPPPNTSRPDYLAQLDKLEREHGLTVARLIGVGERGFDLEAAKAARLYAEADREAGKLDAIRQAAATRAAEIRTAGDSAVELAAIAIANRS